VIIDVPEPVAPDPVGPTNGNDILTGTESADVTISLAGDDEVYGLGGDDRLEGGPGNDSLFGGAGDDILTGGDGANLIYGGEGIDTVDYSDAAGGVTVDLGRGTARSSSGRSIRDTLSDVENVVGSSSSDRIVGDVENNDLDGGAGVSFDYLIGGGGADTIRFNFTSELGDTIADFSRHDSLAFDAEEFVAVHDESTGLIDESEFIVIDDFDVDSDTAESAFVFDSDSGALYYDQSSEGQGYTLVANIDHGSVDAADIGFL
jgi:Ca2+-binding RTX toxin-like protein